MMYAFANAMHNPCSASAMTAEEAFSACAFLLLGSAVPAGSIFVLLAGIWIVCSRIISQKVAA